jgi:hypothetical protein
VTCVAPEGFGRALPITLVTASLVALEGWSHGDCPVPVTVGAPANFSYLDPAVTAVSPSHGPPVGGTRVSLTGSGFGGPLVGLPPKVFLAVDLGTSHTVELPLSVVRYGHGEIVVVMAPASGTNLSLVVQHGSSGERVVVPGAWSFDLPVVLDVVPGGGGRRLDGSGSGNASGSGYELPCDSSNSSATPSCRRRWFPATSSVGWGCPSRVHCQNLCVLSPSHTLALPGVACRISLAPYPCSYLAPDPCGALQLVYATDTRNPLPHATGDGV